MAFTVFITGANRGIGLSCVKSFLENHNAKVFAACRSPSAANDLNALKETHPNLFVVPLTVGDEKSTEEAARIVSSQTDQIDILINNAGIGFGDNKVGEVKPDEFLQTMKVNVLGPMLVVKHFIPLVKKSDQKLIVNVSTMMGSITCTNYLALSSYRVSKAALNMVTKNLSLEFATDNVIVTAVHPGIVKTDMTRPLWDTGYPLDDVAVAGRRLVEYVQTFTMEHSGKLYNCVDKQAIPF